MQGIEITAEQPDIDCTRVAAEGYMFAVSDCTIGVTEAATFANQLAAIKSAGLIAGAMHTPQPDTNTGTLGAIAEALAFCGAITNAGGLGASQIPPAIKLAAAVQASQADMITWLTAWVTQVEAALGTSPMVCTSGDLWRQLTGSSAAFSRLPLVAVAPSLTESHAPTVDGWPSADLWCWSSVESTAAKGPRVAGERVRISRYLGEDWADLITPQIRL